MPGEYKIMKLFFYQKQGLDRLVMSAKGEGGGRPFQQHF